MGAHDKNHINNGICAEEQTKIYINVLITYCHLLPLQEGMKHFRVMTDNSTAISYINSQRGKRSMLCNSVTTEIWGFCIKMGVYISAVHIPEKENTIADLASREI